MTRQLHGAARHPEARAIADRYWAGQTIRRIAADIGRSYSYVHGMLRTAGVTMRHRGGRQPRKDGTA